MITNQLWKTVKILWEFVSFTLACLGFIFVVLLLGIFLSGCTVQPPRPVPVPVATAPLPVPVVAEAVPVATTPPPAPPVIETMDELPQDPDVIKAMRRHEQTGKFQDISTPAVVKYVFDPSRIYTLYCPEWGVLTVRLLPGEVLRRVAAGNSMEWQIEDTEIGLDLPSPVLTIKRGWQAPPIQMTAYTDANIYEFMLLPGGALGNKRTRQVSFYDPEAELRRYQGKVAADAARRKRAQESRLPSLAAEQVREYQVSGDRVAWRPVRVVGDDRHTIVQLPASTGTELPILTVIQDGQEMRVNARTHPPRDGNGPVIVADQAFNEAKLIGEGGAVVITGKVQ